MKALAVVPRRAGSAALVDVPEPPLADGPVLVRTHAIGVCGTDREIVAGAYGDAPPGAPHLVLGHESIGRVVEAPADGALAPGDWVVGIVRRPDPAPCASCAAGEWDMCQNGGYTERGIKARHGFASERYRIEADFAIAVDPQLGELGVLLEPASIVAKAWEHVARIGARALWEPRRALVTGAGPIGLLAALLGVQRGLAVHVHDRATSGPKPALATALGATYGTEDLAAAVHAADVVLECTGAAPIIHAVIAHPRPNAIVCLTGVSARGRTTPVDLGAVNRDLVLENNVVFGTVNANRRHYEAAATALARADRAWLARLITRRYPIAQWPDALAKQPGDVKSILVF